MPVVDRATDTEQHALVERLGAMVQHATWAAVRVGLAERSPDVSWAQLLAAGLLSGVRFTMALFLADLAFPERMLLDQAKVGVLTASALVGLGGSGVLRMASTGRVVPPKTAAPGVA